MIRPRVQEELDPETRSRVRFSSAMLRCHGYSYPHTIYTPSDTYYVLSNGDIDVEDADERDRPSARGREERHP